MEGRPMDLDWQADLDLRIPVNVIIRSGRS
jgi:hypothetical protein